MSYFTKRLKLSGWGRYPYINAYQYEASQYQDILQHIQSGHWIARGAGRSYGDASLNSHIIATHRLCRILHFENSTGIVNCESGVSIGQLINLFAPQGWLPQVIPGTRYVTVGGAIGCDIHGKNHHRAGCFSQSIVSLTLMLANGEILTCSRKHNINLFKATCGGMGLTGIILSAQLQLKKISSCFIKQTTRKTKNLEETLALCIEHHPAHYLTAWVNMTAQNQDLGQALLLTGEHLDQGELNLLPPTKITLPAFFPGIFINPFTIKLFNWLYYAKGKYHHENISDFNQFFFPLDKVRHGNRLYGKKGFLQYHFVIPTEAALSALKEIILACQISGYYSYLSVLKLFGEENQHYLSFPKAGFSFALDFKFHSKLLLFLNKLDEIVLAHGGKIYLAKDARMSSRVFQSSYPYLEDFCYIRQTIDPDAVFRSSLSQRLGIP